MAKALDGWMQQFVVERDDERGHVTLLGNGFVRAIVSTEMLNYREINDGSIHTCEESSTTN